MLMILFMWYGKFNNVPISDWNENFHRANIEGDSYYEWFRVLIQATSMDF